MKAISLWNPWASLVAVGAKRVETRSWPTSYRGRIAIQAGVKKDMGVMIMLGMRPEFRGALWAPGEPNFPFDKRLPFGAIVALADLVDCRRSETFTAEELDTPRLWPGAPGNYTWTERQMGDFSPGRYGFVLENVQKLETPIPCRGFQQIFNVPDDLFRGVALR